MSIAVGQVMSRPVETISADAPVAEAAALMRDAGIGFLPVVEGGELVGVVTDRDLTVRVMARRRDPVETRVRDAMTHEVVACAPDQPIHEVASLMEATALRRLVVRDAQGQAVGVISLDDLAELADEQWRVGSVLEGVVNPFGQA